MDFWGSPLLTLTTSNPPPSSRHLLGPLGLTAPVWGKLRPIETSGLWDYAGTSPSSLGISAGSVLSEHKHSLRDSSTSADLVTGLWAGPSKGGGCPLRREDGTDKRPFVRETPVLHSCLPSSLPQPVSSLVYPEVLALVACPLHGAPEPLPAPAWSWQPRGSGQTQSPELTLLLGLGKVAKGGQAA